MAVLKLPVDPRADNGLYVTQVSRRSPQESAFTGAIQHVIGSGSIWRGYMELPPLFGQHEWNQCKHVIDRVISGSDRLWVPIHEGQPDNVQFVDSFPEFTAEEFCATHLRATLNKAGDKAILSPPTYFRAGGGRDGVTWDADELFLLGTTITFSWWTRAASVWTTDRAAITRATMREHALLGNFTSITTQDVAEIDSLSPAPFQLYWSVSESGNIDLGHSGPLSTINQEFELLELDPPVPHMFRSSTASAGGNWCVIQGNFCEPFLAAVIINDDALGHTTFDRAIQPNRIEFISSNEWGD